VWWGQGYLPLKMAGSATRRLLPSLMAMHLRTLRLDRSCITASSLSSIATCIIPLTSTSLVLQHRLLPAVASDLAYNRHLLLTPNLLSVMTSACVLCPPNFDPLSPFESSVVEKAAQHSTLRRWVLLQLRYWIWNSAWNGLLFEEFIHKNFNICENNILNVEVANVVG
jgi:hypothetical protein